MRSVAVASGAALAVAALGFASGGYYPTAWGWGGLVALWLIATYAVVGNPVRPAPLSLALLGALGLFVAWIWLSLLWSQDPDQTVLEGQRGILYVALAAAFVLVLRGADTEPAVVGILAGLFLPSAWGLATRLFPDRIGVDEATAGYRLSEPLGYWNALGLLAAMGAALALVVALRTGVVTRTLAGAALPVLLATVYFTFSRGSWIALAAGLATWIAIDPRRLQALAGGLALGAPAAVAVWLSSRQDALTRTDAPLAEATSDGHRLALYIVLLALACGGLALLFALGERRYVPSRPVRLAFAAAATLVAVVVLGAVFAREGSPVTLAQRGWDSFSATPGANDPDLRKRLFTFSGSYRVDLWRAAREDFEDHPVAGSGAGSYEHYWNQHRPFWHIVRDAHSLYLEALAELGIVGLALLLVLVGVPIAGAVLARGHPLVPGAAAAFVAYAVHAGVDWDWELPAVTAAALGLAAVISAARQARAWSLPDFARWGIAGAAVALAVLSFVGLVGASALSASDDAYRKGRWSEAQDEARKAHDWWRWSAEPWTRLGDAQLAAGQTEKAADSYRHALAKDRRDWTLWYDLASATSGAESRRALAETARLNRFYRDDLEEGPTRATR